MARAARDAYQSSMKKKLDVLGSLIALVGVACGDDGSSTSGGGGVGAGGAAGGPVDEGGGGAVPALVFGECPAGYTEECATMAVPLDHANPSGEKIDLFLARRQASEPAARQLWLLSGGPGQAGHIFESVVPILSEALPDTDVYVLDHRGTGGSHRLTCNAQEGPDSSGGYILPVAGVPDCLEELELKGDLARLPFFTTTQAAQDLLSAIRATRGPDQQVFLVGSSYGTHWAHRALQLGEEDLDGVVFDGFMTPGAFAFTHYDEGIDEVGAVLTVGCAANTECSSRLGPDPGARARQLWAKLDETPCGELDGRGARTAVSIFVDTGLFEKAFVFPLIHRLERCSSEDIVAIETLLNNYFDALASFIEPPRNSGVLTFNIVLSELWSVPGEPERTVAELESAAEAQTFLVDSSFPASIAALRESWPLPPDDASGLPLPVETTKPLLWLSGGIDSRTPPTQSLAVTDLYSAPSQPLVTLETAPHTPLWTSYLQSNPNGFCGVDLLTTFLAGTLDTACAQDLFPIFYEAPNSAFAEAWWGTPDDWGDATPAPKDQRPTPALRVDPSLTSARARQTLRTLLAR